MADKPKRRNQSPITPGGSQEASLTDVRFPRSPNLPRTSNRQPTPSMNLERSGAKKTAIRKRTLRTDKMTVDEDWSSVYPTAASFKPSTVPLPIRMGYPVKRGVPPEKKGNLELIKVKLSSLNLDDHGRKKLIKLAGERHKKETDMLTFTADRITCLEPAGISSSSGTPAAMLASPAASAMPTPALELPIFTLATCL
ncbi:UNVERIFIED_CONTAM: hypothetical protein FKN15_036866 [Acipenser sinensis]